MKNRRIANTETFFNFETHKLTERKNIEYSDLSSDQKKELVTKFSDELDKFIEKIPSFVLAVDIKFDGFSEKKFISLSKKIKDKNAS